MLADNILFLREEYPTVYQTVKTWEESEQESKAFVEVAKDGHLTLKYVGDEQAVYIHSKYNPLREAQVIVDKLSVDQVIDENTHVVFYGIGLGYHIEEFIMRYPMVCYTIIEPSPDIFACYLANKVLKKILNKNLLMLQCGNQADGVFFKAIQLKDKKLVVFEHPAYPNLFIKEYSEFLNAFRQIVSDQRSHLAANNAFQLRWILNSVNNFKFVLNTPNILLEDTNKYEGKTAILVSAGPSLDFELENLKEIKNKGLAYIFSVGSAINTLIHHGILPHAMCTYDPSELNQYVFDKVFEAKEYSIPMIFGSSVGYEIVEKYQGPKYHVITSQDTVAHYFLKPENENNFEKVNDAPSIAIVTLELLKKMKFDKIVLVGQNLSYLNDQNYASGDVSKPIENDRSTGMQMKKIMTLDVDGNQVETNESFMKFKHQLELYIELFDINVYNSTIRGAYIEGTEFKTLSNIILEFLKERQIDDEFVKLIQTNFYDQKYLQDKMRKFLSSFESYKVLVNQIRTFIGEIQLLLNFNNTNEIEKKHAKMDIKIRELEGNDFFQTITLPVFRVEYGFLLEEIKKFKFEKKSIKRSKAIIQATEHFIDALYAHRYVFNDICFVIEKTAEAFTPVVR